jgi:streptomycin 6-kinase
MNSVNLTHYLRVWELRDPQLLAQTATSDVYAVQSNGTTVVLKALTPIGVADEQQGARALQCFDGRGAVRLWRHDDGAQLLEYVGGEDLIPMVKRGEDQQATAIIAEVLNQLHSAPIETPPDGLTPLIRQFQSLFRIAERDQQAGIGSIFTRAEPIARALLENPRDERTLHGDIHHANIRYHAERGWLAFDPKGLYGERTYDAANTLCNPMDMPELVANEARLLKSAEILAKRLDIALSRILAFVYVYACLSASWSLEDSGEDDARLALSVAEIAERHVVSL